MLILLAVAGIAFITALPMLVVLLTPEPPSRTSQRRADKPALRGTTPSTPQE